MATIVDRYKAHYESLKRKTRFQKINWRPIDEYIDSISFSPCSNNSVAQYVLEIIKTKCIEIHFNKSFYTQRDGYVLILLNYKQTSEKDKTSSERIELIGGVFNSPIRHFPEYLDDGFGSLQEDILKYREERELFGQDISDDYDILGKFTGLD